VLVKNMTILRQCGRAGCDPRACCLEPGKSLGEASVSVLGGAQLALFAIVRNLLQFTGCSRLCQHSFFLQRTIDRTEADYQ